MGWDAAAAVGSIAGAVILLAGAIAAIVQLKHLRLTYQIESYLQIMQTMNSPEMVQARKFVESQDFNDPEVLSAAFEDGKDLQIMQFGGYCQMVARLINLGIADRALFAPFILSVAAMWRSLRPVAYELRKRPPYGPRWLDIEVLVFSNQKTLSAKELTRGYPREILERVNIEHSVERVRQENVDALADPHEVL